jgi:hypothetical protein
MTSPSNLQHEILLGLLDRHTSKLHVIERFCKDMTKWTEEVEARLCMLENQDSVPTRGGPAAVAGVQRCRSCGGTFQFGESCSRCQRR